MASETHSPAHSARIIGVARLQVRRRRREAAAKALQGAWERLQLLAAGVGPAAAGDAAAQATLARHLLHGEGEEAVDALLRYQQVLLPQCKV